MNHYTLDDWLKYVAGSEIDRTAMEAHLSECDACFALYLEALDRAGDALPSLPDAVSFAQVAVNAVRTYTASEQSTAAITVTKRINRGWLSKPIIQYVIAASITLVLVGSGAFQQLFEHYISVSRETQTGNAPARTEQWTEKAGEWLDKLPVKQGWKEGMNDE